MNKYECKNKTKAIQFRKDNFNDIYDILTQEGLIEDEIKTYEKFRKTMIFKFETDFGEIDFRVGYWFIYLPFEIGDCIFWVMSDKEFKKYFRECVDVCITMT